MRSVSYRMNVDDCFQNLLTSDLLIFLFTASTDLSSCRPQVFPSTRPAAVILASSSTGRPHLCCVLPFLRAILILDFLYTSTDGSNRRTIVWSLPLWRGPEPVVLATHPACVRKGGGGWCESTPGYRITTQMLRGLPQYLQAHAGIINPSN
jgi:hypothetical protein